MLSAIVEGVKAIIDLLIKGRENKQRELEIKKLESEQKERENILERASLDDVKRYDPKTKKILKVAGRAAEPTGSRFEYQIPLFSGLLALLALGYLVWKLFEFLFR